MLNEIVVSWTELKSLSAWISLLDSSEPKDMLSREIFRHLEDLARSFQWTVTYLDVWHIYWVFYSEKQKSSGHQSFFTIALVACDFTLRDHAELP